MSAVARRVASLIPSGTEIVAALGLADTLVGRSHCCDYPPGVVELPVLTEPKVDPSLPGRVIDARLREILANETSAYRIRADELAALEPDVVVTQDHCEACAVSLREVEDAVCTVAALAGAEICALHAHDLATLRGDFARAGEALGVPERGRTLVERLDARLAALRDSVAGAPRPRALLLEWLDPPMVAGGWIPELAWIAGLEPLIVTEPHRFETVTWGDARAAEPELVVFMACGFDVDRMRGELAGSDALESVRELAERARLGAWVVDGDAYFNRPGPRLAESAEILARIAHPERLGGEGLAADAAGRWRAAPRQRTMRAPSSSA